jgi:hypothetical protein
MRFSLTKSAKSPNARQSAPEGDFRFHTRQLNLLQSNAKQSDPSRDGRQSHAKARQCNWLRGEGRKLALCATDDAHFSEPDHFGGWVMVKALENTPEVLLDALKAGHHYSSTGPDLRGIHWEADTVTVESSAVQSVIVQGQGSAAVAVHGQSMTRTRVGMDRFRNSDWLRVTVMDAAGKRAWSNPYWRR